MELAGDVAAAATALAGLLLVFIGAVSTGWDSYPGASHASIKKKYRRRAWFGFGGFLVSLASAVLALLGKYWDCVPYVTTAMWLLLGGFVLAVIAALISTLDIR